jgi:predicted RNA-binding protein with PIN domain
MRWLIDGYNVMYAAGWLRGGLRREAFRRARRRFLDDVVASFDAETLGEITVVFDASVPPGDLPVAGAYRGLNVIFALEDESADDRIEQLIARHSTPKMLTVVSSDRRIRQAAERRRARALPAEDYWDLVDREKERAARRARGAPGQSTQSDAADDRAPRPGDAAAWERTFYDAVDGAEARASLRPDDGLLTERDIAEIRRQVERDG